VNQKKINRNTLRSQFITLTVQPLYSSKSYDDVMVMLAKPTEGQVNHLRLTAEQTLTKFQHSEVEITDRQPGQISVNATNHRFTTRFGNGARKVVSNWQVTPRANLEAIAR
jgi:hypothetical protein